MKKILLYIFLLAVPWSVQAQIDRTHAPAPGPAPVINIGTPATFDMPNGLKVFVVENHKVPTVTASLLLKRDPVRENDKAGYIDMEGELMRRGTATKTKEQLDEEIDMLGGRVSTGSKSASCYGLTKNFDRLFGIMADMVLHPSFPAAELEKVRKQTLSALEANKDDPGSISANVSAVMDYGKDHPYGEVETEQTVRNITLEDIKNYYNTYWKPGIGYLVLVGDINTSGARQLVEKYFKGWQKGTVPAHTYPLPQRPDSSFIALIDRPAAVQSNIKITAPIMLKPGSPENIPAQLMNNILGGGSNSYLFMDLREKYGYTYGAYSSIESDPVIGSFTASAAVRNEVTDSALSRMIYQLNSIRNDTVASDILSRFKNSMSGSFARSLENPARIAQFALNIAMYHMPDDYYKNYLKNLAAVTADDVQKAARDLIIPGQSNIVIVGNAKEIAPKLTGFGELRYFDNYGNPVKVPVIQAVPAGITAEEVINRYIRAVGGADKLKAIKDISITATSTMQGTDLILTRKVRLPGRLLVEMSIPAMHTVVMRQSVNGDSVRLQQQGKDIPLNKEARQRIKAGTAIFPELKFGNAGYKMELTGIETVNGTEAYAVKVTDPDGNITRYYFDIHTGYEISIIKKSGTNGEETIQDLSNYKPVDGIMLPFTITARQGQRQLTMEVKEIKINSGLKEEDFSN